MSYIDHMCLRCGHKRIDHIELHTRVCSYHWCPMRCTEDLMELGPSRIFETFTGWDEPVARIDAPGDPILYGVIARTYSCDCFECQSVYLMVAA